MKTHIQIIAWLNIILSVPLMLIGGALMFGVTALGAFDLKTLPFFGLIGGIFFLVILLFAIPGLILGVGLLKLAPWARFFGIVVSILNLFSVHTLGIGTALGIYSLIILFNPETVALFERGY